MKKTIFLLILILPLFVSGASQNFTDNGDGTIKDNVTGLVWQKCSAGQTNDSACSGTEVVKVWKTALSYCEDLVLGGRSDWRLPNIRELLSIVDEFKSNPSINTVYFPATLSSGYWSSSIYVHYTSDAWCVDFSSGHSFHRQVWLEYQKVRCVAGGLN